MTKRDKFRTKLITGQNSDVKNRPRKSMTDGQWSPYSNNAK